MPFGQNTLTQECHRGLLTFLLFIFYLQLIIICQFNNSLNSSSSLNWNLSIIICLSIKWIIISYLLIEVILSKVEFNIIFNHKNNIGYLHKIHFWINTNSKGHLFVLLLSINTSYPNETTQLCVVMLLEMILQVFEVQLSIIWMHCKLKVVLCKQTLQLYLILSNTNNKREYRSSRQ